MAMDPPIGYVKIPGIKGGSARKNFEEQIPIFGYEHKLLRRADATPGDSLPDTLRLPRAVTFDDNMQSGGHSPFVIFKSLDRATVLLFQALNENKTFDKGPIEIAILQSVNGVEIVTFKVCLTKAVVRSVLYSERSGSAPEERVAFIYSEIEWTYDGQDEAGKATGAVSTATSLEK